MMDWWIIRNHVNTESGEYKYFSSHETTKLKSADISSISFLVSDCYVDFASIAFKDFCLTLHAYSSFLLSTHYPREYKTEN